PGVILAIALLVLGAAVLYAGAELSTRGAVGFARSTGLSAFVIGALLFGIDLEGTGAALAAAGSGQTPLGAGTIFGAVLFVLTAAFGAGLLAAREPVPSPSPLMVVAPSLPVMLAAFSIFDRYVDRVEGALLLAMYVAYVYLVLRWSRADAEARGRELENEAGSGTKRRLVLVTVVGLGLLAGGAAILVAGGARLLERTELAAGFVGAAVIGVLASLDEVLLEILPMRRGAPELATGNLFGTVSAFSTAVLGLAAVVRPIDVDGAAGAAFLGMAFIYTVVALVFILRGRAGRVLGGFVLLSYAAWLVATAGV
ncbi:MAG TPA: hypothetical protein VEA19_04900, partial [Actinomycetota bacterium]|nr:hypothetical protein [Actinomycetota bacterium]